MFAILLYECAVGCGTSVTRFFILRLVLYETGAVYQSSHQPGLVWTVASQRKYFPHHADEKGHERLL
ncbi:Transcription factor TFIIB repeat [Musa troglodytarum]|uniref:Transcription factor TFIIB repeat n=1 Tax=Musa troglodytarum TaxID=320322 RepID=A0A9E7K4M5_9LILI|nr:Transcription factor TFIIB repeat [Musa troglodytarum]